MSDRDNVINLDGTPHIQESSPESKAVFEKTIIDHNGLAAQVFTPPDPDFLKSRCINPVCDGTCFFDCYRAE